MTANEPDRLAPQLRVLDGIAAWCGGLHGAMPLRDALQALADGFGAECAALSRHQKTENTPRSVALCDPRGSDGGRPALSRALARDVMGPFYAPARNATLWFLTDLLDEPQWDSTQSLYHWRATRDIAEITVVLLERNARHADFIEFHFTRPLERSEKLELESLLPTLVRAWSGRRTGLVTQAGMDARMARARASVKAERFKWDQPLLGMANPAKLSRAEFRVCLLLSRGLSVKGVTGELGLTEATVRTHLRSIYAKTETSNLAELLYRILSVGTSEPAPDAHLARRA